MECARHHVAGRALDMAGDGHLGAEPESLWTKFPEMEMGGHKEPVDRKTPLAVTRRLSEAPMEKRGFLSRQSFKVHVSVLGACRLSRSQRSLRSSDYGERSVLHKEHRLGSRGEPTPIRKDVVKWSERTLYDTGFIPRSGNRVET